MFFFIAGIQPKTIALDNQARICPSCGLYQAYLNRVDQYLSIFFIPVLRVKKGTPFLQCASCGSMSDDSGEVRPGPRENLSRVCPRCGMPREPGFRFCPYCGKRV